MTECEIDFDDVVDMVFSGQHAKEPGTYKIGFIDELELTDVFEALLMAFTNGSRKLFGDADGRVDLGSWTESEITEMAKRFQSMGVNCRVLVFTGIDDYLDSGILTYKQIMISENTRLDELYFSIRTADGRIYVINYNIL